MYGSTTERTARLRDSANPTSTPVIIPQLSPTAMRSSVARRCCQRKYPCTPQFWEPEGGEVGTQRFPSISSLTTAPGLGRMTGSMPLNRAIAHQMARRLANTESCSVRTLSRFVLRRLESRFRDGVRLRGTARDPEFSLADVAGATGEAAAFIVCVEVVMTQSRPCCLVLCRLISSA